MPEPERTPREIRIAFVEPDPLPSFHHTDVDGDRLFATTAAIPGEGAGIYFRTDPNGSSIPVGRLDELIDRLRVIAAAAKEATDA
jgi:hypothetical protein